MLRVCMFLEVNKNSEKVTALKTECVLGKDAKAPTALPKSVSIAVPGPASGVPSTGRRQLLFRSPCFFSFTKINYRRVTLLDEIDYSKAPTSFYCWLV